MKQPSSQITVPVMIKMTVPIALGFVGIMMMNTVDLICVGRLGATEMAGVGLGNVLWSICFMPGLGLSVGLEFPVSFNFGAKRHTECRRVLIQGFWIVTAFSLVIMLVPWFFFDILKQFVADQRQADIAIKYLSISLWSIWPALVFTISRVYLQALGRVAPAFWVLLLANLINLVADLALVLGWWGFPKLGVEGAAYVTNISRYFMMGALALYMLRVDRRLRVLIKNLNLKPDLSKMLEILKLGIPSSLQVSFEGGVFSLSTILAATFDVVSSAAHQAVLNLASNTFMIPLGLSSASAVLVGQSYGRKSYVDMKRAGNLGFQITIIWMSLSSILFIIFSEYVLGIYTMDPLVIQAGSSLMIVAAAFQITDGIQVIGTGVLRGLGDTKTSMYTNLVGHWLIGLPSGLLFAYHFNLGVKGIWIGLALGLTVVAVILFAMWLVRVKKISEGLR